MRQQIKEFKHFKPGDIAYCEERYAGSLILILEEVNLREMKSGNIYCTKGMMLKNSVIQGLILNLFAYAEKRETWYECLGDT